MSEALEGKEPGGKRGKVQEEAEVSGRSRLVLYVCWNCGATMYIGDDWTHCVCLRCGAKYDL